ncbi:hypothetical protein DB347_18375 [Opitutaceae bacterium EW11]|nr:hypothetical protein DB347_18375 [Opitutaceae bacterium EW11]
MSAAPQVSVVIPAHNRVGPLRDTIQSVLAATRRVAAEIVLVDDGSEPPLSEILGDIGAGLVRHVRQTNQGSIAARLHGLAEARGDHVLFLDSDDLVHPEKFDVILPAIAVARADVAYDDLARPIRENAGWHFESVEALRRSSEPAEFYLRIQPVPHSPTYRRDYLLRHLEKPLIPAKREFDPAGDVWLYYNLCAFPATIVKVDRALTAIGIHNEERYSRHWERIAVAALGVMEAFAAACPQVADLLSTRRVAGECAFDSWRRLPRGFDPDFDRRLLQLWENAPRGPVEHLGGPFFQKLARLFGPKAAGRIIRYSQPRYSRVRSLSPEAYRQLFSK